MRIRSGPAHGGYVSRTGGSKVHGAARAMHGLHRFARKVGWRPGGASGKGATTLALSLAEFNRMVDDHGPALYRMAYRMVGDQHEAEDLVQEAYRSAWKSRKTFRPGGGERAWIVSILRRRVADHWRRPRPPTLFSADKNIELGFPGEDPLRDEFTDEMQQALGLLPDDLRQTLLLVIVAELTHQEAADMLGVPLGTVLSRVSRARKRLREYLLATSRTQ